ncbi:MAG TPA: alkaline phosphatase family protein, partial [Thermoleophilaceae bacterium]|nr:alkaline phosphatase family protein [Thermoleophilaceae bacterium]
ETIEAWDQGDELVTRESERYLRRGDPDAGFVYLGLVDETAHLAGSATPVYAAAIATTDRRIGRLLRAIRARPSYAFESWTILVTTDHGQRPLDYPSIVSHLDDTKLERTAFVLGSGPGLGRGIRKPRVVDILPTVLHQLGLRTPARWNIDGRALTRSRPPSSAIVRARGRGGAKRLVARLRFGAAARRARAVVLRLPAGVRLLGTAADIRVRVNGGPAAFVRLAARRTVTVRPGGKPLRTLTLTTAAGTLRGAGSGDVTLSLRGPRGSRGKLRLPLDR